MTVADAILYVNNMLHYQRSSQDSYSIQQIIERIEIKKNTFVLQNYLSTFLKKLKPT